jgi:pilus assembly protein CpaB
MDVKKLILLVGALIVAGISAFFVRTLVSDSGSPQAAAAVAEPKGPKVLVATTALPMGTILSAESFKYQPWPKDLVENVYYLEGEADLASLNGKVVRVSIPAGQPVTKGSIVGPGERGFLAAALTPGMRAVTVPINSESGVAGFLFPGDRVDMILTHGINAKTTESSNEGKIEDDRDLKVAETILRNVRILAIDQRTNDLGGEDTGPKTGRTVTFEVPPKFVEKIAVAQSLGQISLSLRPLADTTQQLEAEIAAGTVKVGDNQDAEADRRMLLSVSTRPSDNNLSYTTGGEVSRFARASVGGGSSAPTKAQGGPVAEPGVRVFRGGKTQVVPVVMGAK